MTQVRPLLPRWAFDSKHARRRNLRAAKTSALIARRKRSARSKRARREWAKR